MGEADLALLNELMKMPSGRRASSPSGTALAPVIIAARDQQHAIAIALDPQSVAVILASWSQSGLLGTLMPRVEMQNSNALIFSGTSRHRRGLRAVFDPLAFHDERPARIEPGAEKAMKSNGLCAQ
jgi:hypothetical protein